MNNTSTNETTVSLKLSDLNYLIDGEDKYNVYHDKDQNTILVSDSDGNLSLAWRWIVRAIAKNYHEKNILNISPKDLKDVLAEFTSSGTTIHVTISRNGMTSKEGMQLLSLCLDNSTRDLVHKIMNMPDIDYKNVIRLFAELSLANELVMRIDKQSNQSSSLNSSRASN